MHVFLTGSLQIGKSTVLRAVMREAQGPILGFQTAFRGDRTAPDRTLHCCGVDEAPDDTNIVATFHDGKPLAIPGQIDDIGGALLREARRYAALILMDECGRLERDALIFQFEVLQTLDGTTPIIGVVREDAGGWTRAICSHPNVTILTVTEANRDALPAEVLRHLSSL